MRPEVRQECVPVGYEPDVFEYWGSWVTIDRQDNHDVADGRVAGTVFEAEAERLAAEKAAKAKA